MNKLPAYIMISLFVILALALISAMVWAAWVLPIIGIFEVSIFLLMIFYIVGCYRIDNVFFKD